MYSLFGVVGGGNVGGTLTWDGLVSHPHGEERSYGIHLNEQAREAARNTGLAEMLVKKDNTSPRLQAASQGTTSGPTSGAKRNNGRIAGINKV